MLTPVSKRGRNGQVIPRLSTVGRLGVAYSASVRSRMALQRRIIAGARRVREGGCATHGKGGGIRFAVRPCTWF